MSEIDELKRQVEAQGAEIASLRQQLGARTAPSPAQQKPAAPDYGPRIVIAPDFLAPHLRPTEEELAGLLDRVFAVYPRLKPDFGVRFRDLNERDFNIGFEQAFMWLGTRGRAAELDRKHSTDWWEARCHEWIRSIGQSPAGCFPLALAALSWGDVSIGWGQGATLRLGIHPYGGRKATEPTWRGVLDGTIRPRHVDLSGELQTDASRILRVG